MNSSLQMAIERHGGMSAYSQVESIMVEVVRLGGVIPTLKGIGRTFKHPRVVTVYPQCRTATFHQLGPEGEDITYSAGSIIINGKRHDHYRDTFCGLRKLRRWSADDAAYFFGYALTDYLGYPFTLVERKVVATKAMGGNHTRLSVVFPANADTHSQLQSFVFDNTGLLVRHDYCADILGPMFFGAHYSTNYRFDTLIPIAETRNVCIRLGRWATPISVLQAELTVENVTLVKKYDANIPMSPSGGSTAS
jgi:hypothetical protein